MVPTVLIYQREHSHSCDVEWLQSSIAKAMPLCLEQVKDEDAPLPSLTEIEATIVTDEIIGQVHDDFLGDPSPTDVITFHHGELLISADTAAREGPAHGLTLNEELLLYLIHGLLHLGGWDDHEPVEAAQMKAIQEGILAKCLGRGV